MWQLDEGKVIALTWGGLTDVREEKNPKRGVKLAGEVSRHQVRLRHKQQAEGLNNRKSLVQTGRRVDVMKAEYRKSCRQRDSVERERYAGARSIEARKGKIEAVQAT